MANRIKGVTGRFVALSVVFFLIALTVAPPLQRYFSQRAQISAVEAQIDASKERLQNAEAELARWRDPAYIKSQARDRLHFVLPGERQYIVVGAKTEEQKNRAPCITDRLMQAFLQASCVSRPAH